ncbi:primosomal protein N' [Desulfovibrio sp. OttesenSCG-928-F07]|nr:primosomal protein N' [Desulfovibrio sp. OttesenSCG-928-F07]
MAKNGISASPQGRVKVLQAALVSPPFSTLSYLPVAGFSADFWQPGLRLAVPLGRQLRAAVLLEVKEIDLAEQEFTLKEAAWPLEQYGPQGGPLLSPQYLEYAAQFALRQAQPVGRILSNMLPAGLRSVDLRLRFFSPTLPQDIDLRHTLKLAAAERAELAQLWQGGQGKILRSRENADEEYYALKKSPPWPVRPGASKQIAILEYLEGRTQVSRRRLLHELGADASATLKTLITRDLVEIRQEEITLPEASASKAEWAARYESIISTPPPFMLNHEQTDALNACKNVIATGSFAPHLLYGITGSGKTAVYLELAAHVLAQGRKVLLLAPEVALALKLKNNAEERFPGLPVHLFHGYQTPARREAMFRQLSFMNEPALIVGTRSAMFLQLSDIGLIILDEEHDSSFKQDERLNYQAKDLAWFLAARDKALLLLGSATPDLKTFYAVEQGHIKMHRLSDRVGGGTLPEITLATMPRSTAHAGILTPESSEALKECIEAGDQAVILLNRRGYAPNMYCLSCGTVSRCPHCEISLTYHKNRERLVCHYCGYTTPFPQPCPKCRAMHYLPMGEGTEKLEERLATSLPAGARVLRLDRDSTSRVGTMEDILEAFKQGEAEVLVGTQMLSKGHHFPRVSLAIVADGDMGLNMLDYNAAERTFQLILQASGRAGRGEKPGRVIIQTRDPSHYCWQYILRNDYEGFYRHELERRQTRRYPPFVRLALIRISYPTNWPEGAQMLNTIAARLQLAGSELGVSVLGPAPAPYPVREGRYRHQCLLKGSDWQHIRGVYNAVAPLVPQGSKLTISLDIDPATTS